MIEVKKQVMGKESLMEGYVTFTQLGLLITFMVVVGVGGYTAMTVRNVNAAVSDIGAILKENQESLNLAISNIATASENAVAITNDLRTGLGETSKTIETADQVTTYALVIGEAAKSLASLFTSIRNH